MRGASWRTWAELTTSLHRPPNGHLLEQQPGGGRLPAARPPPGDYPGPRRRCAGGGPCGPVGGSRAHRPVDPVQGATARPSRRRRSTVHSDLCDKRGRHKSPMHRGLKGMNPWRAPGTTRPRQLSQQEPQRAGDLFWEESEAMRATKKEEGRGVRAKACAARAVGYSLVVCGQPVPRVQRTTPCRKPVGDFYLPKTGRRGAHRTLGTFACTCSFPNLPCPTAHG